MLRAVIFFLLAAAAVAQTATNRCAVDLANRVVCFRDYIDAGIHQTTLGGWFPFVTAPTNSTTFASGDGSRLRTTLEQSDATARPAWTTNGMTFDGVNDRLYSVGAPSGMWHGIRCWILLTNSITATNAAKTLYSRRSPTAGQGTLVSFGTVTGSLSNETVTVLADPGDPWRVGITNSLSVGWHHLVVSWGSTNYSIYLDGVRHPHIYNVGTSAGVTNNLEYWVGGNLVATSGMLNASVDCFVLMTNAWTAAQIGADYTNGVRRRGL